MRRGGINRGDCVRRKEDPVHVGRVTQVNVGDDYVTYAQVRWFGNDALESRIDVRELEIAEVWK